MNSKQKKLVFVGIFVLFLTCLLYGIVLNWNGASGEILEMEVSLESGLYTEKQELKVEVPKGTIVYYTDDYRTPDSQSGKIYAQPIQLAAEDDVKLYTYRFKAYYPNGRESEVVTRTFFMGRNVDTRYTTNVLHLTGEPEDLFGAEKGIFAFGTMFEEFMAENPDAYLGANFDANFFMRGREWEREVYVEYFTKNGQKILGQDCGVRVYGESTRRKNQKSFKLYARPEYDVQEDFDYPLITKLLSAQDGTVAGKHERLIVRSGGTDNGYGYIRSELVAELASQAGFPDVMHSEPVCVYMNGEYRGIYWLSNTYDEQYFENRYGEYTGSFAVLGGIDVQKEDDPEVQQYVDEYNQLYQKYSNMDLTLDANVKALNELLDIENYLQYFAIQNYVGNWDSIDNNLKVYRYVTEDNSYAEQGAFDGRYRHLLFDLDFGFGLVVQQGMHGSGASARTLSRFLETSPLFAALMERQDCRDYFINYSFSLMNGVMSFDNVSQVLAQKHADRETELRYMLEQTDVQKNSICLAWEGDCIEKYETVEENYQGILSYAQDRGGTVLCDLIETYGFSYEDAYTLYLNKNSDSAKVQINSAYISKNEFSSAYISKVPIVLKPVLSVNEEFVHWIVNGEICAEQELVLGEAEIIDYKIEVQMVTKEIAEPVIMLDSVRANGKEDYIEIVNASQKAISTQGYYLSDSEDCYKYALPAITLQPGEYLRLWGKDCSSLDSLGGFALNFNLKQGETISLTKDESVLETLYIPDLSEGGVYQREETGKGFTEKLGE